VSSAAQSAALASLDDSEELARRCSVKTGAMAELGRILRAQGLEPAGPAVANFHYVDVGADSRPLFEALLREGVIVRPLHGFGAPNAIRVTSGTPEENRFFADALASARGSVPAR
jgi:histidinol-phosphate aminotransferase